MEQIKYRVKNVVTGEYYSQSITWRENPNLVKQKFNYYRNKEGIASESLPDVQISQRIYSLPSIEMKKSYPLFYKGYMWEYPDKVSVKVDKNIAPTDIPSWLTHYPTKWSHEGTFYNSKFAAERIVSQLTKTTMNLRKDKTRMILEAPLGATDFIVVETKVITIYEDL